ncbi:MAG TPA: M56 family metallopeptidase [Steroidobacteraceae bacterium]|nr:M56 family metallopeptidase [Steroidobacteraceae bacterium]
MIIELIAYTTTISLLVGLAAWMIERAISAPAWPRRWLWAIAMTLSLGGSAAMVLSVHRQPSEQVVAPMVIRTEPVTQLPAFNPVAVAPQPREDLDLEKASIPKLLEAPVGWIWLGASFLLLGAYATGSLRLRRAKRSWQSRTIGGYNVWVTPNVGPAVVGFRHPMIVLPNWLLEAPTATRDVALAHEHEHIVARDPRLLLAALLLLALTPWNLALWWQLRRLKLAIEVDCDRRVLRRGMDRKHYADTLLGINQCSGRMPIAAIAIVGRTSQIERRIRTMVAERPKHIGLWIAGWMTAAIPLLVVAADIEPPSAPAAMTDSSSPHAHALLGIGIAEFDVNGAAKAVAALHIGVLVTYVHPGSAADRAGLKKGDVIVKFGQTSISRTADLMTVITHTAPDASAALVVQRGPERKASAVTVHFSPTLPQPSQSSDHSIDISDWDTLRDESLPIKDTKLQAELIQMSGLDQLEAMQSSISKQPPPPPNTSVLGTGSSSFNSGSDANVRRLRAIVAQYGWPTVSMVGVRGAHAAGLIVVMSHDPGFKAEVLALMERLLPHDEVPTQEYAWLYDDVHSPQRFGSQFACVNGVNRPTKPVEDPEHLDERRNALGLFKLPQFCLTAARAENSAGAAPRSQALAKEVVAAAPDSFTINFKDADIGQVANAVVMATHKTLILDPRVHTRMTILSTTPVTPEAFYQVFLSALTLHHLVAMPGAAGAVQIIPFASQGSLPGSDDQSDHGGATSDEILTQVVLVKNMSALQVATVLRPQVPITGQIISYNQGNIVIVSGHASDVSVILKEISRMDQVSAVVR